jgi:Family of unknown function (DUF6461)
MADQETRPDEADWNWISRSGLDAGGQLIFVRDASPQRLIEGLGLDPASARMLTADEATEDLLFFPARDASGNRARPWARVGREGAWAFAIDPALGFTDLDLSALGGEVVVATWTPKPTARVEYFADGELVTSFEPGMEWDRAGSDPDRFRPEMIAAGIDPDDPEPPLPEMDADGELPAGYEKPMLRALRMLTLALGVRLPGHTACGPLLTVQRAAGQPA